MADDEEIAALRERLARLERDRADGALPAPPARRPSVVLATIKLVVTLAALAIGGVLVMALIGSNVPEETAKQKLAKLDQQVAGACDLKWTKTEEAAAACREREYALRAPRVLGE